MVLPHPAPSQSQMAGNSSTCGEDAASWYSLPVQPTPPWGTFSIPPPTSPQTILGGSSTRAETMESSGWTSSGSFLKMHRFNLHLDFMKIEHTWEMSRSLLILCALTSNFLLIRDVYWNIGFNFLRQHHTLISPTQLSIQVPECEWRKRPWESRLHFPLPFTFHFNPGNCKDGGPDGARSARGPYSWTPFLCLGMGLPCELWWEGGHSRRWVSRVSFQVWVQLLLWSSARGGLPPGVLWQCQ